MLKAQQLSIADDAPLVAVGAFDRFVEVWNFETAQVVVRLDTILDFGGKRLFISRDGKCVVTASYRGGIACYSVSSGYLLWHRKDLKKIQTISRARHSPTVFLGFDEAPCVKLDILSGINLGTVRGVRERVESAFADIAVVDGALPKVVDLTGSCQFTVHRETFAVLSWAFSPASLVFSEARGQIRCLTLAEGKELWRSKLLGDCHATQVAYCPKLDQFLAVLYSLLGRNDSLAYFDPDKGNLTDMIDLGKPASIKISNDGRTVITTDGVVYSVVRKRVHSHLQLTGKGS
jgi:outer membrane protein assembly factor BamB